MTHTLFFESSWTGTEKALLAQIATDPSGLVDDAPRLRDYIVNAITFGQPLAISAPVYCNTPIAIVVDGRRVELVNSGNGAIVAGPGVNDRLISIANSADAGDTDRRSVDIIVRNLRTNLQYAPAGALNSVNHYNFSGFRRTIMRDCSLYSGEYYQSAGGDAGIFTTSNRVIISGCIFQGMVDIGVYISGSSDGTLDNCNLVLLGNSYINCANAWSAKRNYQNIRSVGEYFEGCFNGPSCLRASGSGDGLLAGSKVTVVGPAFKNMVNRCIDPRSSSNWAVSGMIVNGTFGLDKDGMPHENASIIAISGTTRSRFDFVADVISTDESHAAVRIQTEDGNVSTDNVVNGTVKGLNIGLIESSPCNGNQIDLLLDADVTVPGVPTGSDSRYGYMQDGVRIAMNGDRQYWDGIASPVSGGSDWTGDDAWIGGSKFYRADGTGALVERLRAGARSTGATATSFQFSVEFAGAARPFSVQETVVLHDVPVRYDGTNKLWDAFNSSKNDNAWTGEDVWLGGHTYLSADSSGTPGEVVRAGVRATGASGTAFGWGVEVAGALKFFVRGDRYDLSLASIGNYADDSAAATAGVPVGSLYRTGSALKIRAA